MRQQTGPKSMKPKEETRRRVMHDLLETFTARLGMIAETLDGQVSLNSLRVRGEIAIALLAGEDVTATDIARRAGLNPATVHRIITGLIDEGAVNERPDPNDGRKRLLGYTDAQWERVAALAGQWIEQSLVCLQRDTEVLSRHGLLAAVAEEAVAEFVIKVRRDGTLKLSGNRALD